MHTVIAILLLCHGFITTAIGWGAVTRPDSPAVQLPSWLHWWPGPFGRSWLVDALHLGKGWAIAVGLVWLGAGCWFWEPLASLAFRCCGTAARSSCSPERRWRWRHSPCPSIPSTSWPS